MEIFPESLSSLSLLWLLTSITILIVFFLLSPFYGNILKQNVEILAPGPPRLPIIGNLHQLGNLPHLSLYKLSQKYGPVMHLKLGQVPTLIISSPEMAEEVLKFQDIKCCNRPDSYGMRKLSYNRKDISFSPYGDYWREMRKLCVIELFNVKRVRSFQHVRDREIAKFVNILSEEALDPNNNFIHLDKKIYSLAKNIICGIGFGTNFEREKLKEKEIQKTIQDAMLVISGFCAADFFPYYGWIIDILTGFRQKLDKCFHEFDKFYESVIQEHLEPSRPRLDHEDITDILIALSKDETGPLRLSKDNIKAVFMDLFLASVDTTSATTVWAMSELAKNPRVMTKVQAEIRKIIGNKTEVEESEIEKLKYFKMVVKETLRLHPAAPLLLPRESMQHCKIGGYNVYPKTRIFVNAWAIGRDINTWSKPDEFYPERFEDSEIDFKGQHYELIPFGAGRRMCPGMTMALASVESILANMLHRFDWQLPSGMKPEDINMEEVVGLTINKKFPLHLVPIQHKHQTE
ncbi:Cytochrome P450, family 71, subfamily B, polypeptide 2 [Heracleum sosnowskyi]|uniref:Cytochrome P450, family 71, subfamily B, polypeptide 2 n=1 Tax=Heracleum sosnowskyi TaxID=360622 RepID=A0AAD8HPU5_9APIA|nr:Cytochrome P450, family 71, subfamily B, polypeptide 2 [Heracleum sosnowskyi]